MLPLTLCEWKCWQMKILSDVQPSFSCRWLQNPKVTILLITKIRISFEKLWPRFCIWGRLQRCLLFSAKKDGFISNVATLVSPKRCFFSWKRSYFVQMSRCGCFFYVGYLYKAIFIPILFCHLYMDVSSPISAQVFDGWFQRCRTDRPPLDGEVLNPWCSLFAAGSKHRGPAMCRMCALISDEAVPWTGRSFCPCVFLTCLFPQYSKVFITIFPVRRCDGIRWSGDVCLSNLGQIFLSNSFLLGPHVGNLKPNPFFWGSYTVSILRHYLCIAELYIF